MNPDYPSPETIAQIPKKISLHSYLPNFKDVSKSYYTVLFISKLRQCNKLIRIDDYELRKLKHLVLYYLLDFVNAYNNNFPLESIPDFFNTVTINIFRYSPKPYAENSDSFDPEEDEPVVDYYWYHLYFIYEMLLRFVYSSQNQYPDYYALVKKHIDGDFVTRLMYLFNYSDPRERDYIKTILHRIYANFMGLRSYIRSSLKSELYYYICGTQYHSGICDILEILGSIINGYATPLKQEHILFLTQCLIPLHKVYYIKMILPQLSYCVSKYIEKDQSISAYVVSYILGYFPRLNSNKEVSFLTELEELLELVQPKQLLINSDDERTVYLQENNNNLWLYYYLFEIIAQCMCSTQFQVAEKAVNMIGNQKFIQLIYYASTAYREKYGVKECEKNAVLGQIGTGDAEIPAGFTARLVGERFNPIFILSRALRANCTSHWNANIRVISEQTLKQLLTLNDNDFPYLDQKIVYDLVLREVQRQARDASWQVIAKAAHANLKKQPGLVAYFEGQQIFDSFTPFDEQYKRGFVPGYSEESLTQNTLYAAEVPEDPLFCRCEELGICHAGMLPEDLTGAIDGFFLTYDGAGPLLAKQIAIKENETPADAMLARGHDLNDALVQNDCIYRIQEFLISKGIAKCNKLNIVIESDFVYYQKMPGKRLANRRASAGIPTTLGIRRKSVTPMSMAAMQAKAELYSFEKHKIDK